jgi:hypothetical protein
LAQEDDSPSGDSDPGREDTPMPDS